ncbi:MAG: endonuclease domain-containing protein, partial [Flavisolibacter sp.]
MSCLQSEYVHVNNKKYEYLGNLSPGCKGITYAYAKELRQEKTQAEEKLWPLLRNRKLKGKKFRRQHPLANYILDFYCHECKLAVELDGYHHNKKEVKEYDDARTKVLNELGISVLRFWNHEVMEHPEKVLEMIAM